MLSFRRDFAPVTRQFFAPSLYILYAKDFNYLIRWVIITYILLDISVVNLHATSAYEGGLLAVTWHYLRSVRLENAGSVIRPGKRHLLTAYAVQFVNTAVVFFTRSKLIAAFVLATLKQ